MLNRVKNYLDVCKNKLVSLFNRNIALSCIIIQSGIHRTSVIRQNCRLYTSELGCYTYVSRNTLIQNTSIGKFCSISEGCSIGMPSHPTDFVSTSPVFLSGRNCLKKNFAKLSYDSCSKTIIGNDVWIGTNSMIKSGIVIGNGAIIGAGAIVTSDIPPYAIVGGVPAKIIRYRFDEKTVKDLLEISWWNLPEHLLSRFGCHIANPSKFISEVNEYLINREVFNK